MSKTYDVRNSMIIRKESVVYDLKPIVRKSIEGMINDVLDNRVSLTTINNLLGFSGWHYSKYIEMWCEICSESFFKHNPDIDDVLYLKDNGDKEWMCSRDDFEEKKV